MGTSGRFTLPSHGGVAWRMHRQPHEFPLAGPFSGDAECRRCRGGSDVMGTTRREYRRPVLDRARTSRTEQVSSVTLVWLQRNLGGAGLRRRASQRCSCSHAFCARSASARVSRYGVPDRGLEGSQGRSYRSHQSALCGALLSRPAFPLLDASPAVSFLGHASTAFPLRALGDAAVAVMAAHRHCGLGFLANEQNSHLLATQLQDSKGLIHRL